MSCRGVLSIVGVPGIAALGLLVAGCAARKSPSDRCRDRRRRSHDTAAARPAGAKLEPTPATEPGPFRFVDIRAGSGVDFIHVSGMTAAKQFPTANGSGVAIFDFDNDGKMDLYFATGNPLPLGSATDVPNRLYKNLGGGRFRDVTERSGLGFRGYCHGVIAGDIDNDGDQDVFLCNYGGDVLFENNGNGTFTDISRRAGVTAAGTWSSSAAFLDFDGDGDLDLYVSRYGDWQWPRDDRFCGDVGPEDPPLLLAQGAANRPARTLSQQRRPDLHRRHDRGGSRPRQTGTASESWPPTATATAVSTCTWPTTRTRTSCT